MPVIDVSTQSNVANMVNQVLLLLGGDPMSKIIRKLALSAETLIKIRVVEAGKDVNEVPFENYAPYSEGYLKWKKSEGAYKGRVDLFGAGKRGKSGMTGGKLMASIQDRLQSNVSILIYVGGASAVYGLAHQIGSYPQPKREWFGISRTENSYLQEQFNFELNSLLKTVKPGNPTKTK